jgi:hypothetical protein
LTEPPVSLPEIPEPPGPLRLTEPADPYGFRRRSLVEVETSFGMLARSLRYQDVLFDRVRGYRRRGAPTLRFEARLYPFARTDLPVLRDLSIEGAAEYAIIADSTRPDGASYPTQSSAASVALGYRLPLGRHALLASVGYGVHSFLLAPAGPASPTNDPTPELPRVEYKQMRVGLGARIAPVGGLVLHASGAYLAVLDPGGIGTDVWFPRAKVNGLELSGGVGYRLHPAVELKAMVQYRRYGFAFHPELGDPYIVGGAADQYMLYTLGLKVSH